MFSSIRLPRWLALAASSFFLTILCLTEVYAASWPERPVRILVPYGAGSPPDLIARVVAQRLGVALGTPVIVENKPGAIGLVAVRELMRLPADGYTLMNLGMTGVTASELLPDQRVDLRASVAPIVQTDWSASVLVVNNQLHVRNVTELVSLLRSKPGEFNFASGGIGTPAHLLAEVLKREQRLDLVHVPFPQFSQAATELISNRVQMMFLTSSVAVPLINAGQIKALAVVSPERIDALPSVPTMAEEGFSQFQRRTWGGFIAKAGTPPEILNRINNEVNKILQMPEVKASITARGNTPAGGSPRQFDELIRSETVFWTEVIRYANVKTQ